MELIESLRNPELVAKFQKVCGVERLPDPQTDADDVDSYQGVLFDSTASYDKYVKRRHSHSYVLQQKCKENNNDRANDFQLEKEGVPPFTSDDSDSDNCQALAQGRYKITPHRINNNLLYYAFKIASFFGDEAFYLTFFPFVVWNLDALIVRQTCYVWCIAMFWGQVAKDIFQWKRPSYPVVRLETDFAQEFSMPSTHAVAASSIPLVLAYTIINRYQISTTLVVCVAVFWCIMVCCSRLYLGVHTVLDLIVGCLFSLVTGAVIIPFISEIDWFVQTNPVSPVLLFLLCLSFSTVFYPAPEIENNTRGDCIQVIATVTGCLMGCWCNYFNGMSYVVEKEEALYVISTPSLKFLATAILRFMTGCITVVLVKTAVKTISVKGVSYVLGLSKPDRHNYQVQLWYKFITYMTLGIIIMWTVPILQVKFGLGRPGFYAEVV